MKKLKFISITVGITVVGITTLVIMHSNLSLSVGVRTYQQQWNTGSRLRID